MECRLQHVRTTYSYALPSWIYRTHTRWPNIDFLLRDILTCVICLQEFMAGDRVLGLLCGHVYHTECLYRWFRASVKSDTATRCPMCREDPFPPIARAGPSGGGQ